MRSSFLLFTLLASTAGAQHLTLTVQAVGEHAITVRGSDSLAPRAATFEVRSVPSGALVRSLSGTSRVQGQNVPVPGLDAGTRYDFQFSVAGISPEAVAVQQATTIFGYTAESVQRNLRHISAQPLLVLQSLAASAEADPETYALMRSALRSAILTARAAEEAALEADLEQRRREAGL